MVSRRESPPPTTSRGSGGHGDGARDLFAHGGVDTDRDVDEVDAAPAEPSRGHGDGARDLFARGGADRDADVARVAAKLGALHHRADDGDDDEYLPRTAGLTDSERTILHGGNEEDGDGSGPERDPCPVTGRRSGVLDDYVVRPAVLGEGHYGCVRECVRRDDRRTYACKSVKKPKSPGLDHLKNEVRILEEMDHEGVMRMVDCYEDEGYVHIVSEAYTGGELFDAIIKNRSPNGCLPEHRAAKIIKSLLEAVAYLHENDVVHRDIKPENILFQSPEDETPKLIDFGLARRHDSREGSAVGIPAGTSYYMAPEVLEGRYDKSCDLWSVGVVAYMLLSGVPPFDGEDDRDVFRAIGRGNLRFPARQWEDKGDAARKFVGRLLRRDPRRRMTAREALRHPWIKSLGQKRARRQSPKMQSRLKYLRIP